jgi:hypothetical protein
MLQGCSAATCLCLDHLGAPAWKAHVHCLFEVSRKQTRPSTCVRHRSPEGPCLLCYRKVGVAVYRRFDRPDPQGTGFSQFWSPQPTLGVGLSVRSASWLMCSMHWCLQASSLVCHTKAADVTHTCTNTKFDTLGCALHHDAKTAVFKASSNNQSLITGRIECKVGMLVKSGRDKKIAWVL